MAILQVARCNNNNNNNIQTYNGKRHIYEKIMPNVEPLFSYGLLQKQEVGVKFNTYVMSKMSKSWAKPVNLIVALKRQVFFVLITVCWFTFDVVALFLFNCNNFFFSSKFEILALLFTIFCLQPFIWYNNGLFFSWWKLVIIIINEIIIIIGDYYWNFGKFFSIFLSLFIEYFYNDDLSK